MSKYFALGEYLKNKPQSHLQMTFAEIEKVIGAPLPPSAFKHRPFWSNNPGNSVMTRVWLDAGWISSEVDMEGRKLVFRRERPAGGQPPYAGSPSSVPSFRRLGGGSVLQVALDPFSVGLAQGFDE